MLRAQSARNSSNVLPPLSGSAGFELNLPVLKLRSSKLGHNFLVRREVTQRHPRPKWDAMNSHPLKSGKENTKPSVFQEMPTSEQRERIREIQRERESGRKSGQQGKNTEEPLKKLSFFL